MIFLIYSETNDTNVASNVGRPEYSYFFVKGLFRPILERIGIVIEITDPALQVDPAWESALCHSEDCVFLCFAPPHRSPIGLRCPTIPVFAWEFDTLPNEAWNGDARQDWRTVLREAGRAIVHSDHTVAAVHSELGPSFPVTCIPAPVWDRYASLRERGGEKSEGVKRTSLEVPATALDSADLSLDGFEHRIDDGLQAEHAHKLLQRRSKPFVIELTGVVYTSVFNPFDGRKHGGEMIRHFIWAFSHRPDVTLILKTTHWDLVRSATYVLLKLAQSRPFECRIILIPDLISPDSYGALIQATSFVVNCSVGEGQCLPLMEFMSCGTPAIAPRNTAMIDYLDDKNAFIVRDSREPSIWPHDERSVYRAMRARIDFGSLLDAFGHSYTVATCDRNRYAAMSNHATQALRRHCSDAVVLDRLHRSLPKPGTECADVRLRTATDKLVVVTGDTD